MSKENIFLLHVEDNPDDVELARLAFEEVKFPHKVVVAMDGAKALEFLLATGEHAGRRKTDTPALILLDLKLPKVDGLEVLRRLKDDPLLKYVLVALLTSSNEEKDRRRAAELGVNLYIQKPVNFDEFGAVALQIKNLLSAFK